MSSPSTHEDFSRSHEVRTSSDRTFGLVFCAFFLIVGILPRLRGGAFRSWALLTAVAVLAVALILPAVLHPFNRLWTALGSLLNKVVSPIATAVPFFLIFTPMAFFLRLCGKDLLRLKYDSECKSYWIQRTPPGPEPKSMANSF